MGNLYSIIIILFSLSGVFLAIWSWRRISASRKTANWPAAQATVIETEKSSKENNLLPLVKFEYEVDGSKYQGIVEVPYGEATMPDFADQFISKFPLGSHMTIYYDASEPTHYKQQIGISLEDKVLFGIGIGAFIMGAVYLAFNL